MPWSQYAIPRIRTRQRADRHDGNRPLNEPHVAVDDFVDDFTEHQRHEEVERREVADRPLTKRSDDNQHAARTRRRHARR
jgi:hypothetical protein